MGRKFSFILGLGVGYVLGTRAGRRRYEQIKEAAGRIWARPWVQSSVENVSGFAKEKAADASEAVAKLIKDKASNSATTKTTKSSAAKPKS